jgi:hypothetical protein
MKKYLLLLTLLISVALSAQVGIGTTNPNASAALDVVSKDKGVLVPRMTQAARNAIPVGAAQTGLLIYQTDVSPGFYYYNGTIWTTFGSGGSGWSLTGDTGTTPGTNNLGTTDAQDFVIAANNTELMRIASGGNMGVGTTTPSTLFHFENGVSVPFLDEDFTGYILTENNTSAGCTESDGWDVTTSGDPNFNCASCAGSYLFIDSDENGCAQDAIAIVPITTDPTSTSINISFDYRYKAYDGPEIFRVYLYQETTTIGQVGGDLVNLTSGDVDTSYSGTLTISPNETYSLRFEYKGTFEYGATVDNVLVSSPLPSLRIDDGNQVDGHVLTSDANGVATWQASVLSGGDQDWAFHTGSTNTDPIYHQGNVKIGTGATLAASTHNLHVHNGATSGSTFGIGSVEFIEDGVADFMFKYHLLPLTDGGQSLGSTSNRWKDAYTVVSTRLADVKRMRDIQPVPYGLDEILKLNPITYQWKEEKMNDFVVPEKDKSQKIGFSAQELLEVLPEVVKTFQWKEYEENPGVLVKKQSDYLSVNYTEIIPVVIKAIQEQQYRIEAIRAENENIKLLIEKL